MDDVDLSLILRISDSLDSLTHFYQNYNTDRIYSQLLVLAPETIRSSVCIMRDVCLTTLLS